MSLVPLVRSCVACGFVMSEHPVPIKATVVVEVDRGFVDYIWIMTRGCGGGWVWVVGCCGGLEEGGSLSAGIL
jgi:hypothetical protein